MPGGKLACPGLAAVPFSLTLGGCGKNQGSAAFYWAVGNLVINGNYEWRKTKAGLVGPGLARELCAFRTVGLSLVRGRWWRLFTAAFVPFPQGGWGGLHVWCHASGSPIGQKAE